MIFTQRAARDSELPANPNGGGVFCRKTGGEKNNKACWRAKGGTSAVGIQLDRPCQCDSANGKRPILANDFVACALQYVKFGDGGRLNNTA